MKKLGLILAALVAGPVAAQSLFNDIATPVVASASLAVAPVASPAADGKYEIDALVLHTPLYAQRLAGRDISAEAARLLSLANSFFDNSKIPVRYRLAGVSAYAGAPERDGFRPNQQKLAEDPAVRALRDQTAADLVVLLRTADFDQGGCGLSALFNGGEESDPPANVDPERDAFAVVAGAATADGFECPQIAHLFAHELGHALGGGHEYSQPNIGTPYGVDFNFYWKPYAHAWSCGIAAAVETTHVAPLYYSIMFAGGGNFGSPPFYTKGTPRGDFFSSPALSLDGIPCGVAQGAAPVAADNARSITEAAPYVAAYRGSSKSVTSGASIFAGAITPAGAALLLLLALFRQLRSPHPLGAVFGP